MKTSIEPILLFGLFGLCVVAMCLILIGTVIERHADYKTSIEIGEQMGAANISAADNPFTSHNERRGWYEGWVKAQQSETDK